jgi:hypothetical protein
MNWKTFQETAPELARLAEERFARSGVALLSTLHKYGSPHPLAQWSRYWPRESCYWG